jgi:hypothetical protein
MKQNLSEEVSKELIQATHEMALLLAKIPKTENLDPSQKAMIEIGKHYSEFFNHVENDLDIAKAHASMSNLIKAGHKAIEKKELSWNHAKMLLIMTYKMKNVLGIDDHAPQFYYTKE